MAQELPGGLRGPKSLPGHSMALELAQGGGCTTIKIHNNLDIVSELWGRPDRAAHHYGTALKLMKAIGSEKHPLRGRLLQSLTMAVSSASSPGDPGLPAKAPVFAVPLMGTRQEGGGVFFKNELLAANLFQGHIIIV